MNDWCVLIDSERRLEFQCILMLKLENMFLCDDTTCLNSIIEMKFCSMMIVFQPGHNI